MTRLLHGLTVLVALLLLFSFSVALLCLPWEEFSPWENRALTTLPTPSWRNLTDGSFADDLSAFCADQFPFRRLWLSAKADAERTLGAQEIGGILLGRDGYLIPRNEYDGLTIAQENFKACEALRVYLQAIHIPTTVSVLPRGIDVLTAYLPPTYDTTRAEAIYSLADTVLPDRLTLTETLREAATSGEPVWYRTDHHWTTHGAYLAYVALAPSLGITPYEPHAFAITTVSENFLGTSHSACGLSDTPSDSVVLYRYEGDEGIAVYDHATDTLSYGLYHKDKLANKDQYAVFLGGNYAHLSIYDTQAPNKPTLLLFKDSFANALIPFLVRHFRLEVIDPRYATEGVLSQLDEIRADAALILFGADTLATTPALRRLSHT